MARFVFQLEAVLRHRRNVEQQRQRELAAAQTQLQRLQNELKALNAEMGQATHELRDGRLVGRVSVEFLLAHRRFVLAMQGKAMGLVQKMSLAQRQIDQARAALAEAAKQRKIMEKLRERHFERWRAALTAKETAELDEIGMQLAYGEIRQQAQA